MADKSGGGFLAVAFVCPTAADFQALLATDIQVAVPLQNLQQMNLPSSFYSVRHVPTCKILL